MPPLPYFLFIVGPVKLLHHLLQRNKNQKLKKTEKMLPSQPLELPRKLRLESINRLWKVMAKENRSMPAFVLNLWYKCSRYQLRKMKIMECLILIGKTFISIFLITVCARIVSGENIQFWKCKVWKFSYRFRIMAIFYFINWKVAAETIFGNTVYALRTYMLWVIGN